MNLSIADDPLPRLFESRGSCHAATLLSMDMRQDVVQPAIGAGLGRADQPGKGRAFTGDAPPARIFDKMTSAEGGTGRWSSSPCFAANRDVPTPAEKAAAEHGEPRKS
ncbi:hypothetical protein [Agrobacterium sp. NPDC089420]|uniref:hypothetical protein n=1 Tax=Agrobacterium sp. NPDC089420 TaxID=3363918 RepID=UPI00384F6CE3